MSGLEMGKFPTRQGPKNFGRTIRAGPEEWVRCQLRIGSDFFREDHRFPSGGAGGGRLDGVCSYGEKGRLGVARDRVALDGP